MTLLSMCSVAAVEEQSDTADDEAIGRAVARHLESAEELLSVEVEVDRRFDDLILRVRVLLTVLDPGQVADRKLDDFGGLTSDLVQSGSVESAALQEETFDLDGTVCIDLALLEGRDKLELVDCNVVHPSRLLPEGVQESLRMQQVSEADRLVEQRLLLDFLHPLHEGDSLLAEDTDPVLRVLRALPELLPRLGHRVLQQRSCFRLDLWSQHFRALEHLDQTGDAFIDECKDFLD